jgi:hypothetical protein
MLASSISTSAGFQIHSATKRDCQTARSDRAIASATKASSTRPSRSPEPGRTRRHTEPPACLSNASVRISVGRFRRRRRACGRLTPEAATHPWWPLRMERSSPAVGSLRGSRCPGAVAFVPAICVGGAAALMDEQARRRPPVHECLSAKPIARRGNPRLPPCGLRPPSCALAAACGRCDGRRPARSPQPTLLLCLITRGPTGSPAELAIHSGRERPWGQLRA